MYRIICQLLTKGLSFSKEFVQSRVGRSRFRPTVATRSALQSSATSSKYSSNVYGLEKKVESLNNYNIALSFFVGGTSAPPLTAGAAVLEPFLLAGAGMVLHHDTENLAPIPSPPSFHTYYPSSGTNPHAFFKTSSFSHSFEKKCWHLVFSDLALGVPKRL